MDSSVKFNVMQVKATNLNMLLIIYLSQKYAKLSIIKLKIKNLGAVT